jgi:hypothetical protein
VEACINGDCTLPNTCTCKVGYEKDATDPKGSRCIPKCENKCINAICTSPNMCLCIAGYVKDRTVMTNNICVRRIRRSSPTFQKWLDSQNWKETDTV